MAILAARPNRILVGLLDLVLVVVAAGGFERRLADGVFWHEAAHRYAGLGVAQDGLYLASGLIVAQGACVVPASASDKPRGLAALR